MLILPERGGDVLNKIISVKSERVPTALTACFLFCLSCQRESLRRRTGYMCGYSVVLWPYRGKDNGELMATMRKMLGTSIVYPSFEITRVSGAIGVYPKE